jgi:hypothetical protein
MRTRMLGRGLALAVVLVGCTPYHPRHGAVPPPAQTKPRAPRVAVVAFDVPQRVSPELGLYVARRLARSLAKSGVDVIDPEGVLRVAARTERCDRAAAAIRVARKVGANRVVFGAVTRYRDGVPGPPAEPASVEYEAVLVRALDGVVLAADRFDDTQQDGASRGFLRGARPLAATEIVDGALDGTAGRFAAAMNGRGAAGPPGRTR